MAEKGKSKKDLSWSDERQTAFDKAKARLAEAVLLQHPPEDGPLRLTVDASDTTIGAQLEQKMGSAPWAPVAFFSRKLSLAETKYSAFDRELLGIYASIRHFRSFLEARIFTVWTDHKPLCTALSSATERSPRQTRHMSFVAEFTSDIRHIKGSENFTADALSRTFTANSVGAVHATAIPTVDYAELAAQQIESGEFQTYARAQTSLVLENVTFDGNSVLCDTSTGRPRPIVPLHSRKAVFNTFHSLSNSGPRPTQKAMTKRFVWLNMKKDIVQWCLECRECQVSKISRHVKAPLVKREPPEGRF